MEKQGLFFPEPLDLAFQVTGLDEINHRLVILGRSWDYKLPEMGLRGKNKIGG